MPDSVVTSTPTSTAGVTYICSSIVEGEGFSDADAVCVVCHYNDGDLERHVGTDINDKFNYHGYVYDPSDLFPDYSTPALTGGNRAKTQIEGKYCEALLRSDPPHPNANPTANPTANPDFNPYTMFVRFMINPEAATLEKQGVGFPVGWAVRGFLPAELVRLNYARLKKSPPEKELTNAMNMLPVFRADLDKDLSVKCKKDWGNCQGTQTLQTCYYISTQPTAQRLNPESLGDQIKRAGPVPSGEKDETVDITNGKWVKKTQTTS